MTWITSDFFLVSPTALAFIPSLLLQAAFIGYLLLLRQKPTTIWLLIGWLGLLSMMIVSQILAYSLYLPLSTYINWLGGILPGLGAVLFFIQFAYRYPRFLFEQEARRARGICLGIILGMATLMLCEIALAPGTVLYNFEQFTYDMPGEPLLSFLNSPLLFSVLHPLGYVWALVIWLRVAVRLSAERLAAQEDGAPPSRRRRGRALLRHLWRPPDQTLATVRAYILFMLFAPLLTVILRIEAYSIWMPTGSFAASFLIALFIFGLIYINSSPQPTTVMVKVVGISLVTLLSLMGLLNQFVMNLRQEAHFNQRAGEVALIHEAIIQGREALSETLLVPDTVEYILRQPLQEEFFAFHYEQLAGQDVRMDLLKWETDRLKQGIAAEDLISEWAAFHQMGGRSPTAMPDLLASTSDGVLRLFRGVFLEPDNHYVRYLFSVEETLYEVGYSYAAYRRLLHQTALPLLALTLGATIVILLVFPLFFRASFLNPLNDLLTGVEKISRGDLNASVPVSVEDEVGFLSRSFNRMGASLQQLTADLREQIRVRQQAELTARDSARRFRQLFENAPLAIFEIDLTPATPRVLNTNRQAELIYGWSAAEFKQMSPEQIILPGSEPEIAHMMAQVQAGETITIETTHRRRDGLPFAVRLSATPDQRDARQNGMRQTPPNTHHNMIVIAQDITMEMQRRSEAAAIAEERRRIAREMHDSLAQTLVGLRMRTRLWQRRLDENPSQLHPELEEMRDVLDESIAEVRRSIFALRPLNLDELGFFSALHRFADDFSAQYRLPIQLEIQGAEVRLPPELELSLFRVVQESLNNVVRHAGAQRISVQIDLSTLSQIQMVIADDGKGFEPTRLVEQARNGHLGLKQMRERIEAVNGQLLIFSAPGQGTRLEISVPVPALAHGTKEHRL